MVGSEDEDEEVIHGAAEEVKGRGVTRVRSIRRSSGDGQRELRNEDVGGDRPSGISDGTGRQFCPWTPRRTSFSCGNDC